MKVFVSSTYNDLALHRAAVDDVVNQMALKFIGMEYFGARPGEPTSVCLREIAASDIFIGIYAYRYGTVPSGAAASVTEQEFDEAIRLGLPLYCFVVDPDHPWPPRLVELQARERLEAFKTKVDRFVRARFTTPDNLAKQVASALQIARQDRAGGERSDYVRNELSAGIHREIQGTIGRKYVRELYVSRKVGRDLKRRLTDPMAPQRMIHSIHSDLIDLAALEAHRSPAGRVAEGTLGFKEATERLRPFSDLGLVLFPAVSLNLELEAIRASCVQAQRQLARAAKFERQDALLARVANRVDELRREVRPVDVIVDRAGGGKTNVLCRLAEELAESVPAFFVNARSIPGADAVAIERYFADAYPLSEHPVELAAAIAAEKGQMAVVIIDAVNEHLEPLKLNAGLQAFVKRLQGHAVRFVVSCRDIYWQYFDDTWWQEHCRDRIRRRLSSFRQSEFTKALRLYLNAYDIDARPIGDAAEQLKHPLLLRFYCEAFHGEPGRPNKLGQVRDIRLVDLFNTYCDTKFSAIQVKLGLVSKDAVWEFVEMLGRLMLADGKRVLRFQQVAGEARSHLGEGEIRQVGTRYVAILDEDIIVEERPSGPGFDLNVNFVYDEFMEYVIAHSVWRDLHRGSRVRCPQVISQASALLAREEEFISVIGVVVYLGCLLSQRQPAEGLRFVDWLTEQNRVGVATDIIERWPASRDDERVFEKLGRVVERADRADDRNRAWDAITKLSHRNWPAFMKQVKSLRTSRVVGPSVMFGALADLGGGVTASDRLKTFRWLVKQATFEKGRLALQERDLEAVVESLESVFRSGGKWWKPSEIRDAKSALRRVQASTKRRLTPKDDRQS